MHKRLLLCVGLLACASMAWGEDYIVEDTVTVGKFLRYLPAISVRQLVLGANEVAHMVSKADTPAQRLINIGDPYATPPVPPSVPLQYRKVVNKLVMEMTTEEKAQVDQAQQIAEAPMKSWQNELTTNDLCSHLFVQGMEEYYDAVKADIDQEVEATTQPTLAMGRELNVKLVREIRKIAKVVCGTVKVRR